MSYIIPDMSDVNAREWGLLKASSFVKRRLSATLACEAVPIGVVVLCRLTQDILHLRYKLF
jgi:hypothetical protein